MDDDTRREFEALGAQILAVQTVMTALLYKMQDEKLLSEAALVGLFDYCDDTLNALALKLGQQAPPKYITRAMQIVDELRSQLGLTKG